MKCCHLTPIVWFFGSVLAFAQAPLPGLRIEPSTGSSILYVHDPAAQPPLTAFLIELVHYPGSYYQLWEDDITQPVGPDVEKKIPITNMTVGAVPNYVKVTAAIYADGATAGVPEKITQLVERRRFVLKTTREIIQRLEQARAGGMPAASVAAALTQRADALPALTKGTQNSQDAINQSGAKSLMKETASHLSEQTIEQMLTVLHASEAALALSKPAL
jgi:hypothetical protein